MEKHFTEWKNQRDAGKLADFLTIMTKRLFAKYGELTEKGDLAEDIDDPDDDALDLEMDKMTEDEQEEFQKRFKEVRNVCVRPWQSFGPEVNQCRFLQKVRDWFNGRNRRSSRGEENILYSLFERVAEILPNPPRRPREAQFYSSLYWTEKIRPVYQEEMARLEEIALKEGTTKPLMINVANKVTKQMWVEESEEVKEEVCGLFLHPSSYLPLYF